MKKLVTLICLLGWVNIAYAIEIDNIEYYYTHSTFGKSAGVQGYSKCIDNPTIQSSIKVSGTSFSSGTYNINHIYYGAFSNCSNLTKIKLPNSIRTIESYAFSGCSNLTSIEIPEGVTSIGDYVFQNCSSLTSIKIPSSVTSIGNNAFSGCSNLTSIEIPEGVTSIGNYVFQNCSSLTSIKIPSSVTSIGNNAFSGCSNLTSIEIPEGVTSIGNYVFEGCTSLTSVKFPESLINIGYNPFLRCSNITNIIISENNENFSLIDGLFLDMQSLSLLCCMPQYHNEFVAIPKNILEIEPRAFVGCSNLTSIEIPEGVTSIGDYAFAGCSSLTSIEIPKNVVRLGDGVLADCEKLEKVYVHGGGQYSIITNGLMSGNQTAVYQISGVTTSNNIYWQLSENGILTVYGEGNVEFPTNADKRFYNLATISTSLTIEEGVTSIGNNAFSGFSGLTSIEIPEGVTSIGDYVFQNCSSLTSIKIPSSVTSIGNNAFSGCSGLTSIEIPEGVTSIGDYVFQNCSSLTSIKIPSSVTSIGNNAFSGCSGLTSIEIQEGVTSIGNYAFLNCISLTNVDLPKSVTSMGNRMFDGCLKLSNINVSYENESFSSFEGILYNKGKSDLIRCPIGKEGEVIIPEGVATILDYAFSGCKSITNIQIPSSVKLIEEFAFYDSFDSNWINDVLYIDGRVIDARTSLAGACTIVDGTRFISDNAFSGCDSLTSIEIPGSVTNIGDYAFLGCINLSVIKFNEGLEVIGNYAFKNCSRLMSIEIPSTVTMIGSYAFEGCNLNKVQVHAINPPYCRSTAFDKKSGLLVCPFESLSKYKKWYNGVNDDFSVFGPEYQQYGVSGTYWFLTQDSILYLTRGEEFKGSLSEISGMIKRIIIDEGVKEISRRGAFENMTNLTSVNLPSTLVNLGSKTFSGCARLTYIVIPSSITSIGDNVFSDCRSLTSIEIPISVTSIGNNAFSGCSSLTNIDIPAGLKNIGNAAFRSCSKLTNIDIPNGVTSIGDYVFNGCSSLTNINIPENVTNIGGNAFYNCSSLTSIEIPESVTNIDMYAFANCSSLVNVQLPSRVTSIGSGVFSGCSGLTSIEFPSSVTSIGSDAFSGCSSITSIEIPEGVTSIGDYAFQNCSGLTSVEIPGSVTSIGRSAFENCSSLTAIDLPIGVTSINRNVFSGCSNLASIKISDDIQSIEISAFNGTALYADEDNWVNDVLFIDGCIIDAKKTLSGDYQVPENTKFVASMAFQFCNKLEQLMIPENIKMQIGSSAFWGCSELKSITVPNTVNDIGSTAFYDCKKLINVTIPGFVKSIGSGAFENCSSLKRIDMPSSVTSIGSSAFSGCVSLESIDLPSGIKAINSETFDGCSGLKEIIVRRNGSRTSDLATCTEESFTDINSDIPVFVPANSVEAYKSHSGWSYFTNILPMRDEVENMECGMYGDNLLYSINEKGDMTITGSGNMKNYTEADPAPWPADAPLSLVVEAGATSIGANAFNGCTELQSVQLPAGLQGIGTNAFAGCGKLDYMTVTEGAMSIGSSAFVNCTALKSVTLPADMRNIGNNSFDNCYSLERIICHAAEPPKLGANGCFAEVMPYIPVYVPMQSIEAYKNAEGWDYFFNFLPIDKLYSGSCGTEGGNLVWNLTEEGVLTISGTGTMAGYGSMREQWYSGDIREVIIGEGATSIGAGAFTGCTFLESIELPSTLTEIGENAFAGCGDVTDIISFSTEPPAIFDGAALRSGTEGSYDGVFDGINPAIPVYVPAESIEAYRNAEGWNYFTNFLPIPADEEGGGVTAIEEAEETTQTELVVTAKDGRVWCNAEEYAIYDLAGRDVTSCNGTLKGIYVVIAENEAVKVAVR